MRSGEILTWVALGMLALLVRIAYVAAQPAVDPTFARPMLDEAFYVAWAQDVARGAGQPAGAFYLAPLYPNLLVVWVLATGGHFAVLYLVQQALSVATAGALAWTARGIGGPAAGISAGLLALGYHPTLFFASRPVGETVAVALLALATMLAARAAGPGIASGALVGLAALARPNLAPVVGVWAALRPRRALLVLGGAAAIVAPVALRNVAASGHLVPISANGGLTLYHGNGLGALGIFTPVVGLSDRVERQRDEATRLASAEAGRSFDPVQADAWWGMRALRTRAADPWGTLRLLAWRAGLLVSTHEIGLESAPAIDPNPWRWAAPVPFAVLVALAACGLAGLGFARTGGWLVWGAVATTAATPLVFYVSSRYRLPLAALLTIPAGVAVAALLGGAERFRQARAIAWALAVGTLSLLAPVHGLTRASDASALSNRAVAWLRAGDVPRASADLSRALTLDTQSGRVWFNAGVLAERRGDPVEAERAYRNALALPPAVADAAGNLGGLLMREGRVEEATPVLERGLAADPFHEVCFTNLVVVLVARQRVAEARSVAERARRAGVRLAPGLLAVLEDGGGAP